MTDGVLVINREKLVVLRNNAAARILPDCAQRALPFPLSEIASPDVREIISVVLDAPGGFMILSRELQLGPSTYIVNLSPIIEPDGETSGAVAMLSDVTSLKKLETAKAMFVSMVAHEVKSPLAATEGWLNLVLSGTLKDDRSEEKRVLGRALTRVKTLRSMVGELLSLTAIQTGNFTLRREPLALGTVVTAAADTAREKAAERKIAIVVDPGSELRVLADRDALMILFGNLVENAVKYGKDGGRVEVSAERSGMYATVRVRDDGIGISPEDCQRVFDEFYRARTEQTASIAGTGLGLSLVKRLAELHEGTVTVQSTLGAGSEFRVDLPLLVEPTAAGTGAGGTY